jgi:hypothetical protein
MRTLTVVLDATDTPKSIAYLATLSTAIPQITDALAPTTPSGRKLRGVLWFQIRGEAGNNIDATDGEARIGFESTNVAANFITSRVVATAHGTPLLPGITHDFISAGPAGIYDFSTIAISGETGDIFQIHYGPL